MATTYKNKDEAQAAADAWNAKFVGAGYAIIYIGHPYASFMKVPRGGHYVVNPWRKII